jgi:hypothetical protein
MAGRIVNQGELIALRCLANAKAPENLVLRLFTNDVDDGLSAAQKEALDEGDFTEATFTGYSSVEIEGDAGGVSNEWTPTGGDPSSVTTTERSFASSADQSAETVYGWYLTTATSGELVAYGYLSSPVTVQNDGDSIGVTPTITAADTGD